MRVTSVNLDVAVRSDSDVAAMTSHTMRERAPDVTNELMMVLARMGRTDLADQMDEFTVRSEDRSRADRRRSFFAGDRQRSYSLELDLRGSMAIIDVDGDDRLVALHILSGDD